MIEKSNASEMTAISEGCRWLVFLYLLFVSLDSFAGPQFLNEIAIRQLIALHQKNSLEQRIEQYSTAFLGVSYKLGPLGEGSAGRYDKNPLYRFDAFDCETYVNTVMAMVLAKNFVDFKKKINQIRYQQGQIAFLRRNHFPGADWIPNNERNGYIAELTYTIAGQRTKIITALINRYNWYQRFTINIIQIPYLSTSQKETLLTQLKKEAGKLPSKSEKVSIAYIPLADLLDDPELIKKIPTGAIILFVGDDDRLTREIGTQLSIFHMGFAIWHNGQLYFRMASSRAGRVLDVRAEDYLKAYLALDILRGISVWSVKEIK